MVATRSPSQVMGASRTVVEISAGGRPNMRLARRVPAMPPAIWAGT